MELRRHRAHGRALLPLVSLAIALATTGAHGSDDTSAIIGGDDAELCDFPSTVLLRDLDGPDGIQGTDDDRPPTRCSGVLVHPRLVLTAAHCVRARGREFQVASFGESVDLDVAEPEVVADVPIERCVRHPDFAPPGDWDLGYCLLAEDAPDVPIVPPLMGCEAEFLSPGQDLVVVGFGQNVDGARPLGHGTKRWTTQTIQPWRYLENNLAVMGLGGNSTCYGDSGGPAFVRVSDDSWRVAALASTLHPVTPTSCGFGAVLEVVHTLVPWVEEDSGVDITPCHDADGSWNPTEGCGDFPLTLLAVDDSWDQSCSDVLRSGPGETCGDPWDPLPDPQASTGSSGGEDSPSLDGTSSDGSSAPNTSSSDSDGTGTSSGLDDDDGGCGCRSVPAEDSIPWALLLGLGAFTRRSRPRTRSSRRPGSA